MNNIATIAVQMRLCLAVLLMGSAAAINAARAQDQPLLIGAGSTFAAPLYERWAQEFYEQTGTRINYYPIGSTGGIRRITAHEFDFGASDAPMTDTEMRAAPGILHIPTVAGAVTVAYHIPGVGPGIHLTSNVIASIFQGQITRWNDARIIKFNPGTAFPDLPIVTVHRSDGSGTTNIFTTYLSEASPTWNKAVGAGKSVHWPIGLAGHGNQGVAEILQDKVGGIGYLELSFAVQDNIPYAAVQNAKGRFIYPSVQSTTVAAEGVTLPSDFRKTITNTTTADGYPITGFTFILVYPDTKPGVKDFLIWALTDGQKNVSDLFYAPLPANVEKRALAAVTALK